MGLVGWRHKDRPPLCPAAFGFGLAQKVVLLVAVGGKHVDYDLYRELGPERMSLQVKDPLSNAVLG